MPWPVSQDYNEAIQNPRTAFQDTELRAGQAATNALGIPIPRSGNFADVYQFHCPVTKNTWAVKCFTREIPGLRDRYRAISAYLTQANLPFTVDFDYLDPGIQIRGLWYPVLKMTWVEGFTLNEFVRDALDKPVLLENLLQLWARMGRRLRDAHLAHADLQHGNVLLVPDNSANSLALKLIDYDGLFVPALAQKKSVELGHPSYQHPQRAREGTYNRELDRFPLLAIGTALRCLRVGGKALWQRHDNGDNLLFREADFQAPERSKLFAELRQLNDGLAQYLVAQLAQACRARLEQTPHLDDLLAQLKTAVPVSQPPKPAARPPAPAAPPRPAAAPRPAAPSRTAAPPQASSSAFAFDEGETAIIRLQNRRRSALLAGVAAAVLVAAGVIAGVVLLRTPPGSARTDTGPAPGPPVFALEALPDMRLTAGESRPLDVRVKGGTGKGTLSASLRDLPPGVSVRDVSPVESTNQVILEIRVNEDANDHEQIVTAVATRGGDSAAGRFKLNVVKSALTAVQPTPTSPGDYRLLTRAAPDVDGKTGVHAWYGAPPGGRLLVNTGDQTAGRLPPRSVNVQLGSADQVVVAWRSPLAATVRVAGRLEQPAGANEAVTWVVARRSGADRTELAHGELANGANQKLSDGWGAASLTEVAVRAGDFLELVVQPRDEAAEAVLVQLVVATADGQTTWDLSRDLLDDPLKENPRGDRQGNPGVWHLCDQPAASADVFTGKTTFEGKGRWWLEGTELVQGEVTPATVFFGDSKWVDYIVEFEAKLERGDHGFHALVRVLGPRRYFDWTLGGVGNRTMGLERHAIKKRFPLGTSDFSLKVNAWYAVRLEVRQKEIKCFLNNQLQVLYTDLQPASGGVGLRCRTAMRVRNLKVTGFDGKALFAGVQNIDPGGQVIVKKAVEPPPEPPKVVPKPAPPAQPLYLSDDGQWRLEGSELVQEVKDKDASLLFGDPAWTDYDFTVDALKTSGTHGFLLAFRAADERNFCAASLGGPSNPELLAQAWEGDKVSPLTKPLKGALHANRWFTFRVEVRGAQYRCFLDNTELFVFTDFRQTRGAVGFVTRSSAVRFRNLKVAAPDGKVLFEGVSAIDPSGKKIVRKSATPDYLKETLRLPPGSFFGRSGAARRELLLEGGGVPEVDAAVTTGLLWLARQQKKDGSWTLAGSDQGLIAPEKENLVAATALALLPFLAEGETPLKGNYPKTVQAGLLYLAARQKDTGDFGDGSIYAHGLATTALCEAYGLTKDPRWRKYAERAVLYLVDAQHEAGGWRYKPKEPGDTSVTGWQVTALKAAEAAGLDVPKETWERAARFLASVAAADGSGGAYQPGGDITPTLSASALLCRQLLGGTGRPAGAAPTVELLLKTPPASLQSSYYHYHATQALRHVGGEPWRDWQLKMRADLLGRQETVKAGATAANAGSWPPKDDLHAQAGGRLMVTSLSLLTLQAYYRHVPLYFRELEGMAK